VFREWPRRGGRGWGPRSRGRAPRCRRLVGAGHELPRGLRRRYCGPARRDVPSCSVSGHFTSSAADAACCCAGTGRVAEHATAAARTLRTTRADDDDLAMPTICWLLLLVLSGDHDSLVDPLILDLALPCMQAPNYPLASLSMHARTELFTRRPTGGGPYTHSIARVASYTPAMKDGTARFETQGIAQRREVAGDLHGRVRHAGHSLASPPPRRSGRPCSAPATAWPCALDTWLPRV